MTPDWLIQSLWIAVMTLIAWIVRELGQISQALAVTTTRLDDHARRLETIETTTPPPKHHTPRSSRI